MTNFPTLIEKTLNLNIGYNESTITCKIVTDNADEGVDVLNLVEHLLGLIDHYNDPKKVNKDLILLNQITKYSTNLIQIEQHLKTVQLADPNNQWIGTVLHLIKELKKQQ